MPGSEARHYAPMLIHSNIDPVAIRLGPLAVHWYGLMYLLGFYGFWKLGARRARMPHVVWPVQRVSDLLFYGVLGVIIGGRVGYTLFYNLPRFLADPLLVLRLWEGGMSFHGGLLGVIASMLVFARRHGIEFFEIADFTAVLVPFGLFTGRVGNFINGELWGKPTELPWGVVFRTAGGAVRRHPSQLYEALLEGLVLLAILWWFGRTPRPRMAISGVFLLCYAVFRFMVEFVRLPDAQIGYLAWGWVTEGQILCVPMFAGGGLLLSLAYKKNRQQSPATQRAR